MTRVAPDDAYRSACAYLRAGRIYVVTAWIIGDPDGQSMSTPGECVAEYGEDVSDLVLGRDMLAAIAAPERVIPWTERARAHPVLARTKCKSYREFYRGLGHASAYQDGAGPLTAYAWRYERQTGWPVKAPKRVLETRAPTPLGKAVRDMLALSQSLNPPPPYRSVR
jgi:hypothetical protein